MATALVVLHVLVCFSLIFIVLVQGGGKGASLGAAFGSGSSQTVFGGRGAATFLNKATTVVAVVFMITALLLAVVSMKGKSSVVDSARPAASAPEQPFEGATPGAPAIPPEETTIPTPGQAPAAPAETPAPPAGQ